jgi:DUF2075 family protein
LELKVSIRSRRAELLHEWVDRLLAGSLDLAAKVADHLWDRDVTFPVFVTRELEEAKRYVRLRYEGEPDKRYGLITKAYAKSVRKYGVDNHFQAQQKLQLGRWFNAPPDDPRSCCQLKESLTEFQVQGLELDLPIVCWGENLLWQEGRWRPRPARTRFPQHDPTRLLMNGYRVLLTRGRDGLIIWLPPETQFDDTEKAILNAGARVLGESEREVVARATRRLA